MVENDHKPLESIVKKPLHRAPKRLQGMLVRILNYDVELKWKKGTDMFIPDMLSRAYPESQSEEQTEFAKVNMVEYVPMGPDRIKDIKEETSKDETLSVLKEVIQKGLPEDKEDVPVQILAYYNVRDELSVQDGLVFRGERLVIPISLRKRMLSLVHKSHLGIESALRRATDCMFWPGMTPEIKQFVSVCDACRTYETENQKETLIPHEVPDRPYSKVGTDLFDFEGKDYLITGP